MMASLVCWLTEGRDQCCCPGLVNIVIVIPSRPEQSL